MPCYHLWVIHRGCMFRTVRISGFEFWIALQAMLMIKQPVVVIFQHRCRRLSHQMLHLLLHHLFQHSNRRTRLSFLRRHLCIQHQATPLKRLPSNLAPIPPCHLRQCHLICQLACHHSSRPIPQAWTHPQSPVFLRRAHQLSILPIVPRIRRQ